MEGKLLKGIFYCKDCGNLDYTEGFCTRCKSVNIEPASQDIIFDHSAHDHLMKAIYVQHDEAFLKTK